MSEEKKPFTVSDRRHFTSEGEVRRSEAGDGAPGTQTKEGEAGGAASPGAAAAPAAEAPTGQREEASPDAPSAPPEADADDDEHGTRFPADFIGLLVSLGAQASALLMGGPEARPDTESARALIELLGVLREKTEGHRTPPEDQLLDGLLYELRMAYVQAMKAGGR
jgi:uncharacterized protein DUF1844